VAGPRLPRLGATRRYSHEDAPGTMTDMTAGEDEWRARLAVDLLGGDDAAPVSRRARLAPEGPTAVEIAFGKARSELTYVLELGRAHHRPVVGSVVGDEIWIRLGEAKLSFRFDRRTTAVHALIVGREATLAWDDGRRAIVSGGGDVVDVESFVREAVDETVRAFKGEEAAADSATRVTPKA
jgi:hypothetical protein